MSKKLSQSKDALCLFHLEMIRFAGDFLGPISITLSNFLLARPHRCAGISRKGEKLCQHIFHQITTPLNEIREHHTFFFDGQTTAVAIMDT